MKPVILSILAKLNEDGYQSHEDEMTHDDIHIRLHGLSSQFNALAQHNDMAEFFKKPLPYPKFDHKSYYAKMKEFSDNNDPEGKEEYLRGLHANDGLKKSMVKESQDDEDDKVARPDFSKSTKSSPPVGQSADIKDFGSAYWNKVKPPQSPGIDDKSFNDYMHKVDSMRRGVVTSSKPPVKTAEVAMQDKVRANMDETSHKLFNELHDSVEGKNYPEHITGTLKEHARDIELFDNPHAFLGRSQATLAQHDPNHTASDLSQRITKHLGAVLEHPYVSEKDKGQIRMSQRLGEVEGMKGSPTFNRGFDKYE